jgi:cell fate (sporulation/competence/biofilm development) regulator YlbF (YheA/YmcA/DUF963 family)
MNNKPFLQPEISEVTIKLGNYLISSEPYVRYALAEQSMDNDDEVRSLMHRLAEAQERVRETQVRGTIIANDLQALSELQLQVKAIPVIKDYNASQQELAKFLQEINTEISQLLGINFALIARHSSCC